MWWSQEEVTTGLELPGLIGYDRGGEGEEARPLWDGRQSFGLGVSDRCR